MVEDGIRGLRMIKKEGYIEGRRMLKMEDKGMRGQNTEGIEGGIRHDSAKKGISLCYVCHMVPYVALSRPSEALYPPCSSPLSAISDSLSAFFEPC